MRIRGVQHVNVQKFCPIPSLFFFTDDECIKTPCYSRHCLDVEKKYTNYICLDVKHSRCESKSKEWVKSNFKLNEIIGKYYPDHTENSYCC